MLWLQMVVAMDTPALAGDANADGVAYVDVGIDGCAVECVYVKRC